MGGRHPIGCQFSLQDKGSNSAELDASAHSPYAGKLVQLPQTSESRVESELQSGTRPRYKTYARRRNGGGRKASLFVRRRVGDYGISTG